MAIYALGITLLFAWLRKESNEGSSESASKQVAFADDLNGTCTKRNGGHSLKKKGKKIVIM